MVSKTTLTYAQAAGFGLLAGLRSMAAPALVSDRVGGHRGRRLRNTPLEPLTSPAAATTLTILAAGEMVADKLPWIPDRTALPSLLWRAASGALVGAAWSRAQGRRAAAGAVLGGAAAVVGTYGGFYLRRQAGRTFHLPDPVVGLLEDAIVLGSGAGLPRVSLRAGSRAG